MNVSVALCTYHGARFLGEQLESIGWQTRRPDEIVLYDDQSIDATVDIARTVCQRAGLPCEIHVNQTRLGVERNFSQAVKNTHGDVIFFCDQDDVWKPHKVEKMLAPFLQNEAVTLVYSDGEIVGPALEPSGYTLFTKNPAKRLEDGDARDVGRRLKEGRSPGIKASAMAFSAGVRDLAGSLPDGVAHDSWIAYWGYALGKVVAVQEVLHYYRRHDQTSGKSSSNTLIAGLHSAKQQSRADMLTEKECLAAALCSRMNQIEQEMPDRLELNKRFFMLRNDARNAARTLHARQQVVSRSGRLSRFLVGFQCMAKGDYLAIPGIVQQMQTCLRDINSS